MDVNTLRIRANREVADLGPRPADHRELEMWVEERRDAVVLLAALADRDPDRLRRAATGEWVAPASRDLLIDAAQEC